MDTTAGWSAVAALRRSRIKGLLEGICLRLMAVGIFVEQYHAESGQAESEIVLDTSKPVQVVDELVCARRRQSRRHAASMG